MEISKRFAVLVALAGMNLIFTINDVSLANLDANPAVSAISAEDMAIYDGAVLASNTLPEAATTYYIKPKEILDVIATGYSSSVDETDDDPYITASGSFVRPGVAASNVLPFGTRFRMPELFGETIFTVEDRMNSRYNGKNWVDIWFESKAKAQVFGRQVSSIEIL